MSEKSTRIISIVALASSLAALALFAFQSPTDTLEAEHRDRIEELEREISYLRGGAFEPRGLQGIARSDANSPVSHFEMSPDDLGEVARIEHDMDEMRWTMTVRGFMPATAEHIERSNTTIFDDGQDAKQKLVALRVLRRANELSDDVVREMIAVFNRTDEARLQEEILDNLDEVTTPELAPTLLKVSAENQNYRVRKVAIDAMSGFLPDPDLENWLIYVSKNDGNSRVRDEANRLLEKFSKKAASN